MTSLLKNQILKHLSKFAKNLSPDKLQLSTFKGQGELHNLELNEQVLTELLELPAWLRLTQATCNHVTLKIHWTKLKSVPIFLSLDEVLVEMETCEDLRPPTPMSNEPSYNSGGKYGFSDRVIDGMTVVVNSVVINFCSPAFQASFQLSRVVLESYSPDWKKKDMRLSRIKDHERGELLLFKRLEWQVLRIEAKSKDNHANGIKTDIPLTPLRLITNQACCKMTIKKKLSDCSVVGSRLVFILDDLLWVLTDAQLVAALHFLQSLSGLVQKATQLTQKQKAKQKLEQQPDKPPVGSHTRNSARLSPAFTRHDVVETSYHVICSRIDLHLCDDMDPKDGRSQHPNLKGGGALQVSFHKLVVDYYPYHRAFGSRDHWLRFNEPSSSRNAWVQQLLSAFYDKLQNKADILLSSDGKTTKESPKHASIHRTSHQTSFSGSTVIENGGPGSPASPEGKPALARKSSTPTSNNSEAITPDASRKNLSSIGRKSSIQINYRYLMSSCFVLRLEDFIVYKVSTSTSSRKHAIEKFLMYNKSAHLPSDIKTVHLEQTSYYLPGELDYPVPSSNLFLHFGPLKLSLDAPTILWLNAFHLNLQKCLMSMKSVAAEAPSLVNIRVEALMPQIVIPTDAKSPSQPDRPKTLQLQASRIIATNCRLGDHASHLHLNECLESFDHESMFYRTLQFPWHSEDNKPISERFMQHILESDFGSQQKSQGISKEIISESSDVWSIHLDPFWADFTVCEAGRTRLQSFIDPLPLTLWFYNSQLVQVSQFSSDHKGSKYTDKSSMSLPELQTLTCQECKIPPLGKAFHSTNANANDICAQEKNSEADMYLLLHVHSLLNVQLSHYQYLFVLRTVDLLAEMVDHIALDTAAILRDKPILSMCVSAWWPKVEVSLILRNLNQLSATSDSVDLASLQEDCSSNSDLHPPVQKNMLQSQSSYSMGEYESNTKLDQSERLCSGILEDCCIENGFPKSCSDSLLNCHSSGSSQASNLPISDMQSTAEMPSDSFQKGFQTGTSAVKRGLCSLVASIDSALTKNDVYNQSDIDATYPDEDALSIRSDISSDLDQFVMINQDDPLELEFFRHPEAEVGVDIATEVKDDTISNYTLNSEKKKEMVSVTIFRLAGLSFSLQSKVASRMMIQCRHIETKEEAAISWENFQNNFSSRSRSYQNEKEQLPRGDSEFSLRIVTDPICNDQGKSSLGESFLKAFASNIHLQLLMSSVSGLVDFFEDEITPKPMPAKIVLDNFHIYLQEDRPPTGLISPNSCPLNISLPGCILERTPDGTVSVLPLPFGFIKNNANDLLNSTCFVDHCLRKSNSIVEACGMVVSQQSSQDNGTSYMCASEELSGSNSYEKPQCKASSVVGLLVENELKTLQQENQTLRQELTLLKSKLNDGKLHQQLEESTNEIARLERENRTLLETLKVLQKEVSQLEKERRNNTLK